MAVTYTNTKVSEGVVGEGVRCFQSHVKSAGTIDFDQLCGLVADRNKDSKASVRATLDTLGEVLTEKLRDGFRCTWDGLAHFELNMEGSFDTIDAPFDPAKNKLIVNAIVYDNVKTAVSDIVPENEVKPADVRINGLQDAETMAQDEYTKGNTLLVQGVGLFLGLESGDEGCGFRKADGTEIPANVSSTTATTIDCSCDAGDLVPGDYTFFVRSRASHAGDADYTLVEATRPIKVVA